MQNISSTLNVNHQLLFVDGNEIRLEFAGWKMVQILFQTALQTGGRGVLGLLESYFYLCC